MNSGHNLAKRGRVTLTPSSLWGRALVAAVQAGGTTQSVANGMGLVAAGKAVGKIAPKDIECAVKLNDDTNFVFELDDFYWNRLLSASFVYEADLLAILQRVRNIPYTFIDGGANYGYWSLLASSKEMGSHPSIAIEALGTTYAKLLRNCERNGHNIEPVHAAISDTVGDVVKITTWGKHAGSSLDAAWLTDRSGVARVEEVRTVTVDSVAAGVADGTPMVVKLDVEGSEVAAFKGSVSALERGAVLLYEDYGEDTECRPTRHLLDQSRLSIYSVGEAGALQRVRSLQDVMALKKVAKSTYNLAATQVGSIFDQEFSKGL